MGRLKEELRFAIGPYFYLFGCHSSKAETNLAFLDIFPLLQTIKAEHIETLPATESSPLPSESDTLGAKGAASVDESDDRAVSAMESGSTPDNNDIATSALDYGIDYSDFTEDNGLVRLPSDAVNADRTVPGVCAICLGPYVEEEQVSWSPEVSCQHAFHTECIIPWLAKKDEPKCPVCRQEFCAAAVVDEAAIGFDLQQREASFLESFSQALALSQMYRPYTSESGNTITLQLANLAIRDRTANAAIEAGLHMTPEPEPARNASPSEGGAEASSSFTTERSMRERPSSEIDQGTDDHANADTSGTSQTLR